MPEPAESPAEKPKSQDKKTEKPADKTPKKADKTTAAKKACQHRPAIQGKSLKGGKKSGKFRYYKDITDMKSCIAKCCVMDANCDVAYMEGGKCYSISCFQKGLCMAVDKRPNDVTPVMAFMDHFLKSGEEAESTELDQGLGEC